MAAHERHPNSARCSRVVSRRAWHDKSELWGKAIKYVSPQITRAVDDPISLSCGIHSDHPDVITTRVFCFSERFDRPRSIQNFLVQAVLA